MEGQGSGGSLATDGLGDTPPPQSQDGVSGVARDDGGQQQRAVTPPANGTRVALAEEYRSVPSLAKYMDEAGTVDPNVLANSYVHAERMIGRDRIPLPKDENDQEGYERAYSALGRPEKPDAYEIPKPEKLPDGMQYDDDGEKYLRQLGWQNGFNNKQILAMRDAYMKREGERMENYREWQQSSRQQAEETLRREHGHGYDKFLRTAKVALREFADSDLLEELDRTGFGNDPRLLRAFGKAGSALLGEQKLRDGDRQPGGSGDIDADIANYREKHSQALMDPHHPQHQMHSDQLTLLFQRKFPR